MHLNRGKAVAARLGGLTLLLAIAGADPMHGATAPGLALGSAARGYHVRIRANLHSDARWFDGYEPDAADTLLFRRLSLNTEATVADNFRLRLMPDFSASKINVLDAYVAYRVDAALTVLAGKTKSPFDLERLVPQTDLLFVERAYSTSLSPNRDVGLQIFGELAAQRVAYQLGWVNGANDNDSVALSHIRPRAWVARGFAQPFNHLLQSPLRRLGLGVALSVGPKTATAPASYRTLAQQLFFAWRGDVRHDGSHLRVEPQALYYAGRLGLLASWVASRPTLTRVSQAVSRRLTQKAWTLASHWVLTGEPATSRGVVPARRFRWTGRDPGAVELALRWSELAVDAAAFPNFANPATSWRRGRTATLGLNWHLNAHVKAVLNFERTWFRGALTRATRARGDAVLARVQLRY